MRWNPSLALCIATLGCLPFPRGAGHGPTAPGELYFTHPGHDDSAAPIVDALVRELDATRATLDLALYAFDLPPVVAAVRDAHDRGVSVRVVGEEANADDPGFVELAEAGVPVTFRSSGAGIMHHKVVVFDGATVWTGSMNFTESGTSLNDNDALLVASPPLAARYGEELDQLFAGAFGRAKAPIADAPVVDGVTLLTAPPHDTPAALVAAIDAASASVHFLVFSFTRADVAEALVRARDRGVEVVGVVDAVQAAGPWSQDDWLVEQEIEVYIDGNHENIGFTGGKLHHKLVVVDGGTPDAVVITGSSNWSNAAANDNDENLLRIENSALAGAYEAHFWDRVDEALADAPP